MRILVVLASLTGLLGASPTGQVLENLGDAPLYNAGMFQGDIMGFDPEDRNSIVDAHLLWPEGVLYYELDESVESIREYILDGMNDYLGKTCITFKERTPEIKDYVKISWWQGCWSMVGRIGGEQAMSLGSGCHYKGLVVHELGHALGFYHEQMRDDRDDFIEIIWENILEGLEAQFTKMKTWEANFLGEGFDYESIMLYEETAFSKDGVAFTIKPKQAGVTIGPVWKKHGLSQSDIRRVNRLYQCFGNVRPDPPEVPDYNCDFEVDDCGIINQENMGSYFNRRMETIDGRTSSMLVMSDDDTGDRSSGGRLITPHFQNFGRSEACLSFDYFMDGPGVEHMTIDMQARSTDQVNRFDGSSNGWKKWQRTIRYEDHDPRFFITAVHRVKGSQFTFAVDNFRFTLHPC